VAAGLAGLLISCWNAVAPAADCAAEAAMLAKEQSELPRLEVASPADRPPYCITLETVMAFAGRVRTHDWSRRRNDYARLFSQYRCKRTR